LERTQSKLGWSSCWYIFFLWGISCLLKKNKEKLSFLQQHLKAIDDVIRFTLENVYKENLQQPKVSLVRGLFLIGAIDSASQAAGFEDKQFIELAITVLREAGFSDELRNKIILFHQGRHNGNADTGYKAIMMGGQCYVELINGNNDAPLGGAAFIMDQIHNSAFPEAI